MRMKPIPLMAFGLFFTINLSTERYLLVEIEDGVEGEMPEHTGVLFINVTYVMFLISKLLI